MESLFAHHLERARAGVAFNALADCHAEGLDSIVLHDEPGNRVRMFYADWHHVLHRNTGREEFSIAVHPHHCSIRLVHLFGSPRNDVYGITPHPAGDFAEMAYRSAIGGAGTMEPTGARAFLSCVRQQPIKGAIRLEAYELHTIYVPRDAKAAWLVIEGAEDAGYTAHCWTNATRPFNPEGMYRPMSPAEVAGRLDDVLSRIAKATA